MLEPQVCTNTGLTIVDCDCDDCTSVRLDVIADMINDRNDLMDKEILSQIETFKEMFDDYYTKAETNNIIRMSSGVELVVGEELPNDPLENTMYFIPNNTDANVNRRYRHFIFVNGGWETLDAITLANNLYYAVKYKGDNAERVITYNSGDTNKFPEYTDLFAETDKQFNGWKYEGETTINAPGATIDLDKAAKGVNADFNEE